MSDSQKFDASLPSNKKSVNENEQDPLLNYKSFFIMRNLDDIDMISALAVGESTLVSRYLELISRGEGRGN
jgi:hypothetical protein